MFSPAQDMKLMSFQLQSLDEFLGEPVTQALPRSFVTRPAISCNEARCPTSSRFSGWRSGVSSRLATMTRGQPAKQFNPCSPELEKAWEVGACEYFRQNGLSVCKGGFKTQQDDNESLGDETTSTASSDPFGTQCVCFDLTDSDDESDTDSDSDCALSTVHIARAQRKPRNHSIEAAFDDERFLARCVWPEPRDFAAGASGPK